MFLDPALAGFFYVTIVVSFQGWFHYREQLVRVYAEMR